MGDDTWDETGAVYFGRGIDLTIGESFEAPISFDSESTSITVC